jgi:hypothetical protein
MGTRDDARDLHDDVKHSDEVDTVQRLGRYGYVVYGAVHIVLGFLAASLAFGGSSEEASTSGAMQTLADQPFGLALIWAIAVGMALLVLWQGIEAVLDPDDEGTKGRLKAAGKAIGYGVVAAVAFRFALSGGSGGGGGGSSEESLTARLLQLPLGRVLVGAVAVGILAVAGYHVYKGLSRKFMADVETADLSARGRTIVEWTGLIGYPAKGVAYGAIGVLFLLAAVSADSEDAGGLDEGLAALRDAPGGPVIIVVVGAGFALFGVYCLARARSAGDFTGFAGR